MALVCKECGNQVSDTAKACPQCREKIKKNGLLRKIGIGFGLLFALSVLSAIFGSHSPTKTSSSAASKNEGNTDKIINRSRLIASCQVAWEIQNKARLKDPDSLDWDRHNATIGTYKNKVVIVIPYRAKNGFNALNLSEAICEFDSKAGETTHVLK